MQMSPNPGIVAYPLPQESPNTLAMQHWQATILGPEDSPFKDFYFKLSIDVGPRYPMEPPTIRFVSPIYHPNIDCEGRICLDQLKVQPLGSWSPCLNINTLLLSIRLLMAYPNVEDGLVPEITEECRRDRDLWFLNARKRCLAIDLMIEENKYKDYNDAEIDDHNKKRVKTTS